MSTATEHLLLPHGGGIWNGVKTAMLLALLTALLLWIGQAIGGAQGVVVALAFALVMNFVSYWWSDKIALRVHHAQPLPREQAPWLYEMVGRLAARADIPAPPIYVIPTMTPNAFATGRGPKHAAVAVTQGILQLMDRRELEGVLGHELGHVKNHDTLTMTVVATLAGAISMIGSLLRWTAIFGGFGGGSDRDRGASGLELLFMAIVAPLVAMLIQLAISRRREYAADEAGAELSGSPDALADALERLEAGNRARPFDNAPAMAHLFIVNHLSGRGLTGLFSTHPPIEERVRRLRAMSGTAPLVS
ncbi:MAG TPA: zinc metalloprotease HtpX [Myxococcales bacterium]|nr:zinc metalloprotease HtpX [Myxococcales bacterium]